MTNKKGNIFLPIISAVAILAIVAAGYFFWQNQQYKGQSLHSYAPPITPDNATPVPTTQGQTNNWKAYFNSELGISFNHPVTLTNFGQISGALNGNPEKIVSFGDAETGIQGTDAPFDGFTIYAISLPAGKTLKSYLDEEKQSLLQSYKAMQGTENPNAGKEDLIKVAGVQGVLLEGYGWDNISRYYVLMPNQKTILSIGKMSSQQSFNQIFDQILSTFKFTNNDIQILYTNPNYPGLKIYYNPSWSINVIENAESNLPNIKNTNITMSKNGATLTFSLKPSTGFGWGNDCYKNGEITYTSLSNKWTRVKSTSGYTYTTMLFTKGSSEFSSIFQTILGSSGEKVESYSICGSGINESAMAIKSIYALPNNFGGDGLQKMSAVFDIRLTFSGQENETLLDEADSFVAKMLYPSVWN